MLIMYFTQIITYSGTTFLDFMDGGTLPRISIQHHSDQGQHIPVDEVEWFLKSIRSPDEVIGVECTFPRYSLRQHFDQDDATRPNCNWFWVLIHSPWHLHFRNRSDKVRNVYIGKCKHPEVKTAKCKTDVNYNCKN